MEMAAQEVARFASSSSGYLLISGRIVNRTGKGVAEKGVDRKTGQLPFEIDKCSPARLRGHLMTS
jgi:hypothetical protein